MLIIEHRKNTVAELKNVPLQHGVEIDIRSHGNRLVLHHDPFCEGEDFEEWLKSYRHQCIILNVKEEGIEKRVQELLDKQNIKDYFYLDLSFPFLVKRMLSGEQKIAVRFSEYESIETCLSLAGKIEWVWVDCFSRFPLDEEAFRRLSRHFKICLVSPELVGRQEDIKIIQGQIAGMRINAVCTKRPEMWSDRK